MKTNMRYINFSLIILLTLMCSGCKQPKESWKPNTNWGHWRFGHKSDKEFLENNKFTVTMGQGAPRFENTPREEFDQAMEKAKIFNKQYHDEGYILLGYISPSINGQSGSNSDTPTKDQIRLLKFYNESWDGYEDYIGPKPEEDPTTWMMVRSDGTFPYYRYAPYGQETGPSFEAWGCPNNPNFIHLMEGRLRAQAETGLDGSYIDWTQISGETCYCKYCNSNFKEYLKENLPVDIANKKYQTADFENISLPEKSGDPFWMEWLQFRGYSVAEMHKHLRAVARNYNPNFMLSGNVFGGFGFGPIAYDAAGNMEMLGADGCHDFLYSEIQEFLDTAPRKNDEGTKISNSPALKFLAAASHGKPVFVYATEITPPIFPNPTDKCLSAMAQINIAEAVANHALFREKRETPEGATQIYNFLAANEASLDGAQMYSKVAVVASLNQYLADEISFSFTTSRVLADRGISHVMLTENDLLTPSLKDYDLIVLPYLPLLSIEIQEALVNYVKQGGKLIVTGASGNKDQYNVPFEKIILAGLFPQGTYPAELTQIEAEKGTMVYIPLDVTNNKYLIEMKSRGEYTTFGPTMAHMFPDIPEGYTRNRINPELRKVLENIPDQILKLKNDEVSRLAENYPYVEMTTMINDSKNEMLIHLVNYDVTLDGDITSAENIKLQIKVPEGKTVQSVKYSGTLSSMNDVAFEVSQSQNLVHLNIDQLNTYGLAIISF